MSGQIFSKAKKIVTSRPDEILELPTSYLPRYIVQIYGINEDGIKQICNDICGEDISSQVFSHIDSHPDLLYYCHVPINCVFIVYSVYDFFKDKRYDSLPENITALMVSPLRLLSVKKHDCDTSTKNLNTKILSDLKKISHLAWNGIKKQTILFSQK